MSIDLNNLPADYHLRVPERDRNACLKMLVINLTRSTLCDADTAARFLHRIAPNLTAIVGDYDKATGTYMWKAVMERIKEIKAEAASDVRDSHTGLKSNMGSMTLD
jgi:uncharacterized protein involved in tolerance to divalent cations